MKMKNEKDTKNLPKSGDAGAAVGRKGNRRRTKKMRNHQNVANTEVHLRKENRNNFIALYFNFRINLI